MAKPAAMQQISFTLPWFTKSKCMSSEIPQDRIRAAFLRAGGEDAGTIKKFRTNFVLPEILVVPETFENSNAK